MVSAWTTRTSYPDLRCATISTKNRTEMAKKISCGKITVTSSRFVRFLKFLVLKKSYIFAPQDLHIRSLLQWIFRVATIVCMSPLFGHCLSYPTQYLAHNSAFLTSRRSHYWVLLVILYTCAGNASTRVPIAEAKSFPITRSDTFSSQFTRSCSTP